MKLTEQQLAQMFQHSKNNPLDYTVNDLTACVDAGEQRLAEVEKIADNSTMSASYQIINQLQDWSKAVGTEIQLSYKPNFLSNLMYWFKPALATAAMVTAVYFIVPNMNSGLDNQNIQQQTDTIMFTTSFEENSDVIKSLSFDASKPSSQPDIITKNTFG